MLSGFTRGEPVVKIFIAEWNQQWDGMLEMTWKYEGMVLADDKEHAKLLIKREYCCSDVTRLQEIGNVTDSTLRPGFFLRNIVSKS